MSEKYNTLVHKPLRPLRILLRTLKESTSNTYLNIIHFVGNPVMDCSGGISANLTLWISSHTVIRYEKINFVKK